MTSWVPRSLDAASPPVAGVRREAIRGYFIHEKYARLALSELHRHQHQFRLFFLVRWGFLLHDWLSPPASHTPAIHAAKCSFIKSFARFPTRFSCIFVFVTTSLEKEKAQSGDESLLISSLSHQKTSARVSVRKFSQSLSVRLSVQTYPPCWSCNKKSKSSNYWCRAKLKAAKLHPEWGNKVLQILSRGQTWVVLR